MKLLTNDIKKKSPSLLNDVPIKYIRKRTMQPINRSVTGNLHINSNQADVVNLKSRIEENRLFFDNLKNSKPFQNLLILMREADVPDECLSDFLMGKCSLETCLGEKPWMTALLVKTYGGLQAWRPGSHFLSEPLSTTLSVIFKQGYFESAEKSHSKFYTLMSYIKSVEDSEALDLKGADLSNVALDGANLSGANLSKAKLVGAGLSRANLYKANLVEADLNTADLSGAILSEADLTKVQLWRANLSEANLSKANLFESGLSAANLSNANLAGAELQKVDFQWADLSEADLSGANLSGANLIHAIVKIDQLINVKLIGAKSNSDLISTLIKKQEMEAV
ncbi:MAG: pentapeptide repeat protein [Solimicrobium sp.]|jgi:uncharacterized protein YjbI with pentapeptide repeats|nr:pentapeptide repeat protein [Solimicrobium sp.]